MTAKTVNFLENKVVLSKVRKKRIENQVDSRINIPDSAHFEVPLPPPEDKADFAKFLSLHHHEMHICSPELCTTYLNRQAWGGFFVQSYLSQAGGQVVPGQRLSDSFVVGHVR